MAYLEKRNENYRVVFRLDGKRFSRSLDTNSETAADLALAKVKDGLHRIKLGLLQIDPADDLISVLLSGGSVRQIPVSARRLRLVDYWMTISIRSQRARLKKTAFGC